MAFDKGLVAAARVFSSSWECWESPLRQIRTTPPHDEHGYFYLLGPTKRPESGEVQAALVCTKRDAIKPGLL